MTITSKLRAHPCSNRSLEALDRSYFRNFLQKNYPVCAPSDRRMKKAYRKFLSEPELPAQGWLENRQKRAALDEIQFHGTSNI